MVLKELFGLNKLFITLENIAIHGTFSKGKSFYFFYN